MTWGVYTVTVQVNVLAGVGQRFYDESYWVMLPVIGEYHPLREFVVHLATNLSTSGRIRRRPSGEIAAVTDLAGSDGHWVEFVFEVVEDGIVFVADRARTNGYELSVLTDQGWATFEVWKSDNPHIADPYTLYVFHRNGGQKVVDWYTFSEDATQPDGVNQYGGSLLGRPSLLPTEQQVGDLRSLPNNTLEAVTRRLVSLTI